MHLLVWKNSHCSLVCHQAHFSTAQASQFCACREGEMAVIHTAVMTFWQAVKCRQQSDDESQVPSHCVQGTRLVLKGLTFHFFVVLYLGQTFRTVLKYCGHTTRCQWFVQRRVSPSRATYLSQKSSGSIFPFPQPPWTSLNRQCDLKGHYLLRASEGGELFDNCFLSTKVSLWWGWHCSDSHLTLLCFARFTGG